MVRQGSIDLIQSGLTVGQMPVEWQAKSVDGALSFIVNER